MKRGTKVKVAFEGIVINSVHDDGIRVSVKKPKLKESWWAVVPLAAVTKVKHGS